MSSRSRKIKLLRAELGRGSQAGFTLLEVLVVMFILVFISMGIYEAITQTYRLRDILSTEGDFYNSIRLAMNIVQRDISLIYSPLNIVPGSNASPTPPGLPLSPAQAQQNALLQQGDLGQEQAYWGPAIHVTGIRPSRFQGTDSKFSFITASHMRVYKDAPESELAKVAYSLDKDDEDPNLQVLVKTESTDVWEPEDRNDTTTRNYRLLHGIKSFKVTYYHKVDNELKDVRSWDSDSPDTQNQYPDMIELTIQVQGPQGMTFDGVYRFRPEYPLNGMDPST